MITKVCTTCGDELPATEQFFHKESKGKYGLRSRCKKCRRKEKVQYYNDNKEKIVSYNKVYKILHEPVKKIRQPKTNNINSKLFLEC